MGQQELPAKHAPHGGGHSLPIGFIQFLYCPQKSSKPTNLRMLHQRIKQTPTLGHRANEVFLTSTMGPSFLANSHKAIPFFWSRFPTCHADWQAMVAGTSTLFHNQGTQEDTQKPWQAWEPCDRSALCWAVENICGRTARDSPAPNSYLGMQPA